MRRACFRSNLDRHPGACAATFGCAGSGARSGAPGGDEQAAAAAARRRRRRHQPAAAAPAAAAAGGSGQRRAAPAAAAAGRAAATAAAAARPAAPAAAAVAPEARRQRLRHGGPVGGAADAGIDMPVDPDRADQGQRLRRRRLPEPDVQGADHAGGRRGRGWRSASSSSRPTSPNDVVVLTFDDVPDPHPQARPTGGPTPTSGDGDWTQEAGRLAGREQPAQRLLHQLEQLVRLQQAPGMQRHDASSC